MADCTKFYAPSEQGGSITCDQFNESQLELQTLCNEVNAIAANLVEEFTSLTSGDRVTVSMTLNSVVRVFRNGLYVLSTEYITSGNQVIFTTGVPFGSSPGGAGTEDIVVIYA